MIQAAVEPRRVVRRSLAESLLTCPAFEREDSEVLAFGSAFHTFAAAYTLLCKQAGEETRFTDIARLAAEAWARTPGLLQGRFDEHMRLCEQFAETFAMDLATLTHIEHTETLDVGDMVLTATMDRIDRVDRGDPDDAPTRELVVDRKTERAELDHGFQKRFYTQIRLLAHPNLEEVGFAIQWVRDGMASEIEWYRRGELDLWWKTMLAGLRERLALPDPQPIGGPACMDCAKRFDCPKALTVARETPETDDQADELFEELLRMEAAVDARKEGLKAWYGDHEWRVAHGHEIGYLVPRTPHLVITAAPADLRKWLKKHHHDADVAFKPNLEVLAPLGSKLVEDGLAAREYSKPTFKHRKFVAERKKVRKSVEEANV